MFTSRLNEASFSRRVRQTLSGNGANPAIVQRVRAISVTEKNFEQIKRLTRTNPTNTQANYNPWVHFSVHSLLVKNVPRRERERQRESLSDRVLP